MDDELPRLLVLGGSTEGSAFAARMAASGTVTVVTSLAGRTASPNPVAGHLRIGGFGGVAGLSRWLEEEAVAAVVDATHPFTARMPWNAAAACEARGLPRLRLRRPGWTPGEGDRWTVVTDLAAAASTLQALGARRVFLTTGRQELGPFANLPGVWFLTRSIDPPDPMPLARAEVLLDRGPFDEAGELAVMADRRIEVLVTKNSGGAAAEAKLIAARRLGIPVVMVARPPAPPGPCVTTVEGAVDWCASTLDLDLPGEEG